MKKSERTFFISIATLIVVAFAIYSLRKSKADKQYVLTETSALIGLSIDDIILANPDRLVPKSGTEAPKDSAEKKVDVLKVIWNSGVDIPSKLYFSALAAQPQTFYSLQPIKNYDKWLKMLTDDLLLDVELLDSAAQLQKLHINAYVDLLFDQEHFLMRISAKKDLDFDRMRELLHDKEQWVHLKDKIEVPELLKKQQLYYYDLAGEQSFYANLSTGKIQFHASHKLKQPLADTIQARDIANEADILVFWNSLPWGEIPLLDNYVAKYTGIKENRLAKGYGGYMDLVVKADSTLQLDTIVAYEYDENFNSIATEAVQETYIPIIENAWKASGKVVSALPKKLFYQFHSRAFDGLTINSTDTIGEPILSFKPQSPLYLYADIGRWPATWRIGIFNRLATQKLVIRLDSKISKDNRLELEGELSFIEK